MSQSQLGPVRVLVVEDNPGDVDLILEVFKDASRPIEVTIAVDGVEALRILRSSEDLPSLVMLDLNLPKKDGRTVLSEIKADARLSHLPVLVLSSSDAGRDLQDAYRLGASCFVTKPAELDAFFHTLRTIEQFWFHIARLPTRSG